MVPIIVIIIIKVMLLSVALLVGRSLSIKSMFGFGNTSIGSGVPTSNRTNNCVTHPTSSAQQAVAQTSEVPKVNFNINLFHPSQSIDNEQGGRMLRNSYYSFNDELKINYIKRNDMISMLKNEANDSVDSKERKPNLTVKRHRHRTLSF